MDEAVLPASHSGGLVSIPGETVWDLWWILLRWAMYLGFSPVSIITSVLLGNLHVHVASTRNKQAKPGKLPEKQRSFRKLWRIE